MAMLLLPVIVLAATVLLSADAAAQATGPVADYYVSPAGSDEWSGTLADANADGSDGPFATVARALEAVRKARAARGDRPFTILVRGGTYALTQPLRFTPLDSSETAPLTVAAYPGETPVLSGGSPITGWRRGEGELWTTVVPGVRDGQWYFHQLWVNGQRRTRARTPNEGYLYIVRRLEAPADAAQDVKDREIRIGFEYAEGDLKTWSGLEDVNIILYHAWTASVHWIASLDEEARVVRFTAPCGWPVGYWDQPTRYYVENYREAMDAPGEWYLDRQTGELTYWPLPGEDMTTAQVMAPRLQHLVEIAGDAEVGLPVSHLTLRGLCFQHAEWVHDRNTTADGQAATHLSAAIVAAGARHCTLEYCEVAHVGEYGIILGEGCKHNRIAHCEIHDLGGGGVRLGMTDLPAEPERQAEYNVVDNCFIHDGGHVFQAGIGVWIGRSSYNTVSHNEICDFYYSGCSVGWSWGYAPSTAHHNVFEYNHIHHLGKFVLSDLGGIYSLGISPGTVERYNLIHDVYSYSYGGWGLYTDEGSSDILLEHNVVYNTKSGGFHQHYGRGNILRNNIFAFAHESNIIRSREEEHLSFTFERNIVLTHNGRPLGGNWNNGQYLLDHNLYWDVGGTELDFAGRTFEEWQESGQDRHSLIVDPLFVDAANGDFRLRENSPAFALGFTSFDLQDVGLYGEPEWVTRPRSIVRTPVPLPPVPLPQPIVDDFEDTPVGERPRNATVSGEDKGASIRVTDETAATGQRSLKLKDAAGLDRNWQPHMYYWPGFTTGEAHLRFAVRMEPGAVLWHEWRDRFNPYRVGPSLQILENGQLMIGDRPLMTVPHSEWIGVEITCGLGRASTGAWTLAVTVPGEGPRIFEGLPLGTPRFRRLEWLGFVSLADGPSVLYLDDLSLQQR